MDNGTTKKEGRWAKKRRLKKEKESREEKKEKAVYRDKGRLKLQAMFKAGFGESRASDKFKSKTDDKIYSKSTFETYKKQYRYFCDFLKEQKPEVKTMDQAKNSVDDYLLYLMEKERSAYSISTAKAALSKVFGVPATSFIETPSRTRANIVRSRYETVRGKELSKKTELKYSRFTSALGLRKSEMEEIRAEDLFFEKGRPYLNVTRGTKGGRPRVAEIVGVSEEETRDIVKWILLRKGKLFPKLPSHYDNHFYRGVYAKRIYNRYARPLDKIPMKERYIMRKDRAGETFDKVAMKIASQSLGHNRISVIAQSYLY
jgi:hypothetical protein